MKKPMGNQIPVSLVLNVGQETAVGCGAFLRDDNTLTIVSVASEDHHRKVS